MTFQAPKGVSEYVPPRSALFEEATEAFANSARRACYGRMETAVFEDTALFVRGVGESSDVVVSLTSGQVVCRTVLDPLTDGQLPIIDNDFALVEEIVRADPVR